MAKWKMHRPPGQLTTEQRKAAFDTRRGTAAQRGYDARWRKLRALQLSEEPLCREHGKQGLVVAATEVDHIIPHRGDAALFFDKGNLQSLCKPCHSRKTALHDGAFGRAPVQGG